MQPPRHADDHEWIQPKRGAWLPYQTEERIAICLESGVRPEEAVRTAEVEAARWERPQRPAQGASASPGKHSSK